MRYLIVNGDDFGRCSQINSAIIKAHQNGVLTSASLMVNEASSGEAVSLAKKNPALGVGIHITLVQGRPSLSAASIKPLLDSGGTFFHNPVMAGLRFFFLKMCRDALRFEIEAQIQKFLETGLVPTHLDGHLNIHLHPTVFPIVLEMLKQFDIKALRVPNENFLLHRAIDGRRVLWKATHAFIFKVLANSARKKLREDKLCFPDHTLGLLQSGYMGHDFVFRILPLLPEGVTEISFHPAEGALPQELAVYGYHYMEELKTLLDPGFRDLVLREKIELINYGDLERICYEKVDKQI